MNTTSRYTRMAPALIACVLAGCGTDEDATTQVTAEGVYGGDLTGSTAGATDFVSLVQDNGTIWALYGEVMDDASFGLYGFVQGNGTSGNGTFTAGNAHDFGVVPAAASTVTATYSASPKELSGTITTAGTVIQFTGGAIPNSPYSYDTPASMTDIAGTWAATNLEGAMVSLVITAGGAVTISGSGACTGSGSVAPRPASGNGSFTPSVAGKNVFDISISFATDAACPVSGQSTSGIALTYTFGQLRQAQLLVAVTNSAHSAGTGLSAFH